MKNQDFEPINEDQKIQIASLAGSARLLVIVAITAASAYLFEKLLLIVQLLSKGI